MEESPATHSEGGEASAVCENVGEAKPDIAGIGILVGFTGQAIISLLLASWVVFLTKSGRLEIKHAKGSKEHAVERKRLESVTEILMVGNDIQMLTGIAYMITLFTVAATIDLYHFHLVFDTVSLVGISNAAAMVCWAFCTAKHPESRLAFHLDRSTLPDRGFARAIAKRRHHYLLILRSTRHRITYIFALMYLALFVILTSRLGEWDVASAEPGKCYHTNLLTSSEASHPATDKAYVTVTGIWLLGVLLGALFGNPGRRKFTLGIAFLQFPVHLYMMISLRVANQGHLEGPESETGWDFGQTAAVLLLGVTINELVDKALEFWRWEKRLRSGDGDDADPEMGGKVEGDNGDQSPDATEERNEKTGREEGTQTETRLEQEGGAQEVVERRA